MECNLEEQRVLEELEVEVQELLVQVLPQQEQLIQVVEVEVEEVIQVDQVDQVDQV